MEKRFFVLKENINGLQIVLDGEEHTHLSKVLRFREGDYVECFYDGSEILNCKIKSITKNNTILEIIDEQQCEQNPKTNLTLFQALPKLDKLELVCQKLTELGVKQIIPFSSKFCIAKENQNKLDRYQKIIISSCKQCGRTDLLNLTKTLSFEEMLKKLKEFDYVIFACELENHNENLMEQLQKYDLKNKSIAYIIGSEGGFSQDEADKIKQEKNVVTISLGKRILRTETASIAMGAILQSILGEF